MAREFWQMFLPENIVVKSARWDGKAGTAELNFCYPGNTEVFKVKFVRSGPTDHSDWHLEEII